jgi:hypothetical protein
MSRSVTFQRFLCMAIAALMIPQCEIAHSLALDKSASRNPIQDELTFEQAVKLRRVSSPLQKIMRQILLNSLHDIPGLAGVSNRSNMQITNTASK